MSVDEYKKEIRDYCEQLKKNIKEDMELMSQNIVDILNPSNVEQPKKSKKNYVYNIPLPSEISIRETIELIEGSYCVTFDIKCGLRHFKNQIYIGSILDVALVSTELKRSIENSIKQCLEYDRGQISEIGESGKIFNIQAL